MESEIHIKRQIHDTDNRHTQYARIRIKQYYQYVGVWIRLHRVPVPTMYVCMQLDMLQIHSRIFAIHIKFIFTCDYLISLDIFISARLPTNCMLSLSDVAQHSGSKFVRVDNNYIIRIPSWDSQPQTKQRYYVEAQLRKSQ